MTDIELYRELSRVLLKIMSWTDWREEDMALISRLNHEICLRIKKEVLSVPGHGCIRLQKDIGELSKIASALLFDEELMGKDE